MDASAWDLLAGFGEGLTPEVELASLLSESLSGFREAGAPTDYLWERATRERRGESPGEESARSGILGVGLWSTTKKALKPAVFVHESLASRRARPLALTPAAVFVQALSPRIWLDSFVAIGLPYPQPMVGPGAGITSAGGDGTLGARVEDDDGALCVTTAGHVVANLGERVEIGMGKAIFVEHLDTHPVAEDRADIAVVLLDGDADDSGGPPISQVVGAHQNDNVTVFGRHGVRSGWVRGVSVSWAREQGGGSWGRVYVTDRALSIPGDSGSPVLISETEGLCGHIVAGDPDSYSLIQSAGYQF